MNELIYFETFAYPWEYAALTTQYYSDGCQHGTYSSPASFASAAIAEFVQTRVQNQQILWDSGDFVYGLS